MITFKKDAARTMSRQLVQAAVDMQTHINKATKATRVPTLIDLDCRVILAIDERYRLAGSAMWYPLINEEWVDSAVEKKLPFNPKQAFVYTMVHVHESQREQGLGKSLFNEIHLDAKDEGFTTRVSFVAGDEIASFESHYSPMQVVEDLVIYGKPVHYSVLSE